MYLIAKTTGRRIWVPARPTGEDIAHLIDADTTARISAPFDEKITALPILIGQCQPAATPFFGRANFGHAHQGRPQTISIDLHHVTRQHI